MLCCTSSWLIPFATPILQLCNYVTNLSKIYTTLCIVHIKDLIYVVIIIVIIFCQFLVHIMSSNAPYKSDLFDGAWVCFLQMIHQHYQPSIVDAIPSSNPQPINELKRHAYHQFITWMKCASIIFEYFAKMVALVSSYLSITHWIEKTYILTLLWWL